MPKSTKATGPTAKKTSEKKNKTAATATKASVTSMPKTQDITISTEEQIRRRAYEIYKERGGHGGTAQEDWLQAEIQIRGKRTA
ncbi:MAG TPA: DUF2934 domain-containing protein [Clostridia bacterium]|nr:DUF2934 domain-containing protein [Clostridia bacterium]